MVELDIFDVGTEAVVEAAAASLLTPGLSWALAFGLDFRGLAVPDEAIEAGAAFEETLVAGLAEAAEGRVVGFFLTGTTLSSLVLSIFGLLPPTGTLCAGLN